MSLDSCLLTSIKLMLAETTHSVITLDCWTCPSRKFHKEMYKLDIYAKKMQFGGFSTCLVSLFVSLYMNSYINKYSVF